MTTPVIQNAFTTGEMSPSLLGRADTQRYRMGAATMRNMFVSYLGGAYSRGGTAFVGYSKQIGRAYPPRLIPFQFNVNQGLSLEFGNQYMRVISNGAYVVEQGLTITGLTNANPGIITLALNTMTSVTVNTAGITASYQPGEIITLAGGSFTTPAQVQVDTTALVSCAISNAGDTTVGYAGYSPGDIITLTDSSGGAYTTQPQVQVLTTKIGGTPTILANGYGGTNGAHQTVTGISGNGTRFTLDVQISGGSLVAINSVISAGVYTSTPGPFYLYSGYFEGVTGSGLVGAAVILPSMIIDTFSVLSSGVLTANPSSDLQQLVTSGAGTGAAFNTAKFVPNDIEVAVGGIYSSTPSNPIAQASTSLTGAGATFNVVFSTANILASGDWVYLTNINGMTDLNGRTVVVQSVGGSQFQINDVFGNPIDTSAFGAYTGAGTAARIYTMPMPYAEQDLPYIKFTQSADVMSLACVNTISGVEYPPYDLGRVSDSKWTLTHIALDPKVTPPTSVSGSATAQPSGATASAYYQYVITAVNTSDGTESIASPIASIPDAVDIAATAGSITLTWSEVTGVNQYNIYKATPAYAPVGYAGTPPPIGALFGYAGSAFGTQFIDSNVLADFAQVPPLHRDPFARGRILNAVVDNVGSGYTSIPALTINTTTGTNGIIRPIVVSNQVVAFIVDNEGRNYKPGDTITLSGGGGSGATAHLVLAPQSGTYPSVVSYYQERRVYANSLNNPDSYWMSQPGAFLNFDSRIPTIASDAITGTPWSVQVNGLQWFVPMPGGLVALTGLSAWQLTGAGGSSVNPQAITPSSQQAQPQAYNGCSPTVPPVKVDYDIIYVQEKGSIYRDLAYQFFTNIYTGSDLTTNSSHLFRKHLIREHAWAEEPYRTLWSIRDDGILLTLTYVKPEQISGWARSDTQGLFKSVCAITEPPVDAVYFAVQRQINGNTSYMVERMDNRLWSAAEECWCVDAALALPQPSPSANLSVSSATGAGACNSAVALFGGQNYSAFTTGAVVDDNGNGPGSGATVSLTIVDGVITSVSFPIGGANYVNPRLDFFDPTGAGAGASAQIVLDNSSTLSTDVSIFTVGSVGSVIRCGGGIATITAYVSPTQVTANINSPILSTLQDGGPLLPFVSGDWTMTAPVTVVTGLWHLAGATVTGLADGNVISPRLVAANGTVTLDSPASAIVIGLAYQVQFQSIYLDTGNPTIQGQRKKVAAASVLIEQSRGLKMGSNQPDGSTLSPPRVSVPWSALDVVPDKGTAPYNALCTPLYTGYVRVPVSGGYDLPGQICLQQDNPLPLQILDLVPEVLAGDEPEQQAPQKEKRQRDGR